MIEHKYTVVIIEDIKEDPYKNPKDITHKHTHKPKECHKEITAVHLPVQSFLNTPPLLQ
jgi:hypothetical protein